MLVQLIGVSPRGEWPAQITLQPTSNLRIRPESLANKHVFCEPRTNDHSRPPIRGESARAVEGSYGPCQTQNG
jgi:hypothetical protein